MLILLILLTLLQSTIHLPGISAVPSVVAAIIGGLMFLTINHPGWKEIGRCLFFAGVLAFLLQFR